MSGQQPTAEISSGIVSAKPGSTSANRIAFVLGSAVYSVDTSSVAEIIHPLPLTRIPNCPPVIEGVAALRGELIAILNIGLIVDLEQLPLETQRSKWIVLSRSPGFTQFAFAVDKMVELVVGERTLNSEASGQRPGSKAAPDFPILDIESVVAKIETCFTDN